MRRPLGFVPAWFSLCGALAVFAGCGAGGGGAAPSAPTAAATVAPQPGPFVPLSHVVIIVQENRSVDNLFSGFPGADTAASGTTSTGQTVALQPVGLEVPTDIAHSHRNFLREYAGGKLYFDQGSPSGASPTFPYSYVPRSQTVPYWSLAQQWTFADRMFQSNSGPSFPAHLYLIGGQSASSAENPTAMPWGCDAGPSVTVALLDTNGNESSSAAPCFDFQTLADKLDAKALPWKYYAPAYGGPTSGYQWSAFDAIAHIRNGPHWTSEIVSPETRVLSDIAAGRLAAVTWIAPSWQNSDHAGGGTTGPEWVANVVNAIGGSSFWKSTAIIITWDDWGGWYDHVVPPQLDAMGLGFRVPLIVVSPYAKQSYISHVQHEFGSIVRFAEAVFELPGLAGVDARADDLADCFDFAQPPAAFRPVQTRLRATDFLSQKPSERPPDDELSGLVRVTDQGLLLPRAATI